MSYNYDAKLYFFCSLSRFQVITNLGQTFLDCIIDELDNAVNYKKKFS